MSEGVNLNFKIAIFVFTQKDTTLSVKSLELPRSETLTCQNGKQMEMEPIKLKMDVREENINKEITRSLRTEKNDDLLNQKTEVTRVRIDSRGALEENKNGIFLSLKIKEDRCVITFYERYNNLRKLGTLNFFFKAR